MSKRLVPLLLGCFVLAACTAEPAPAPPISSTSYPPPPPLGPLRGTPPTGPTGIRLLLPTTPPTLLDADTGRSEPVPGTPAGADRVNYVFRPGDVPFIDSTSPKDCAETCSVPPTVLAYDKPGGPARPLGQARTFGGSADGKAVWMMRQDSPGGCELVRVPLDGSPAGPGSSADCDTAVGGENHSGLLLRFFGQELRSVLIDPASGRTLQQFGEVLAIAPDYLLAKEGDGFILFNARTGQPRKVDAPPSAGDSVAATVSRDGRHFAVSFGDQSISGTDTESYDLWLLDAETGTWLHPPSMPAKLDLKKTAVDWTTAGDVVLADSSAGLGVALWKPGTPTWTITKTPVPGGWFGTMAVL
jgi:hypothetical protein